MLEPGADSFSFSLPPLSRRPAAEAAYWWPVEEGAALEFPPEGEVETTVAPEPGECDREFDEAEVATEEAGDVIALLGEVASEKALEAERERR